MIEFTLDIQPKSIQFGNRIGRNRRGKAIMFSSARKSGYQNLVRLRAMEHIPINPLTGPLRVDLTFILPRPKSLMGKSDPDGLIRHDVRPDRDNLTKGTQDGLSAAGFWLDDAQICSGNTEKYYAEKGGSPRIIVVITPLSA